MATKPVNFDDYEAALSSGKAQKDKEQNQALYKVLVKNRKEAAKENAENKLAGKSYYTNRINKSLNAPVKQGKLSKGYNKVAQKLVGSLMTQNGGQIPKIKYKNLHYPDAPYQTQNPSPIIHNGFPKRTNYLQLLNKARQRKAMAEATGTQPATNLNLPTPQTPQEEDLANYYADLISAQQRHITAQTSPDRRNKLREAITQARHDLMLLSTRPNPKWNILNAPNTFKDFNLNVTGVSEDNILKAPNVFAKSENNPSILSNFRKAKSVLNTKDAGNNINWNDNIFSASNPNRWDIMKKRPVEGW